MSDKNKSFEKYRRKLNITLNSFFYDIPGFEGKPFPQGLKKEHYFYRELQYGKSEQDDVVVNKKKKNMKVPTLFKCHTKWSTILFSALTLSISCTQVNNGGKHEDYLYQYSIIDALLAGVYDGNLTFRELKTKGDFGIGGFNGLDGEMLMNEGVVYKIRFDGSVQIIPDDGKTSIAFVKKFVPDTTYTIKGELNYEQLKMRLENELNKNEIYAIRITGSFSRMTTRAPEPATKPYPPLAEHLKQHQHEFDLIQTEGIGVGFYMPPFLKGLNVPGFHFHYLSNDKKSGGHILDFTFDTLKIEIDKTPGLIVETIDSDAFRQANLEKNRQSETQQVESGKY